MGFVTGILLILLGLLAASSLIATYSEDAGDAIAKLRPIQGTLGLIGVVAGIGLLLQVLLSVGGVGFKAAGFGTLLVVFLAPALMAAVGFLMGFSMITGLIANNKEARAKANSFYEKLSPYQVALGLIAVAVGVIRFFV